ncbi:MAG: metallopeptidase TldD-related protein [candidate division WOR-3 bacterium]|uniref:Metalloprotease TldD/E C-terminal domain-containing protein n=1 Tax=candidate division WOR-3 bacterium TaxID=2052148 RepID=A0A7C3IHQ3_UNCW3|nr:metallopeptidase TldD-related protein [candidate division WOR-3 bacterium]
MLETRIRNLLLEARDYARKQGLNAEFSFHRERSSLIRLGNSAIALSTAEELSRLDVSVQEGRRVGSWTLTADITSFDQLREALNRAAENCRNSLEKDYEPIFGAVEEPVDDTTGFDPRLETISPVAKSELCARVIKALKPRGTYDFSGSWSTGATEMYYLTTANDHEAYRKLTDGRLVLVLKDQVKKWELAVEKTQKRAGEFTAEEIIQEFEALLPIYEKNPGYKTEIGNQRVLFGPQAIAQLVSLCVWGGFFGRAYEEGRAFTSRNRFGDKIFSEMVTLIDDPTNPDVFGMPFDFNGKRRRPFPLVKNGIFTNVTYDSQTAAKYGKQPTGHDLNNWDLVFGTGTGPADLKSAMELAGNALYIPHLHYVHLPDPTRGIFTGSSRFNALLIRDGRPVAPLFSSRITDSIPNVFNNVVAVAARSVAQNESSTYERRAPEAQSVPAWLLCDQVRISDVADSF